MGYIKAIAILYLLLPLILVATDVQISWVKTYGEEGYNTGLDICPTRDGGYIIVGGTNTFGSLGLDILLIKIDNKGNVIWKKTYLGSDGEQGRAAIETSEGGYLVVGDKYYLDNRGDIKGVGLILIKTDRNGNVLWNLTLPGVLPISSSPVFEVDNTYVVFWKAHDFVNRTWTIGLIRVSHDGKLLANTTILEKTWVSISSAQRTSDGYVLVGTLINKTGAYITVIKIDAQGKYLKTYIYDKGLGEYVLRTRDGDLLVIGITSAIRKSDTIVIRTDAEGGVKWRKVLKSDKGVFALYATEARVGGYVLAGGMGIVVQENVTCWITKIDTEGNKEWETTYGISGGGFCRSIAPSPDGGYVALGETQDEKGNSKIMVLKLLPTSPTFSSAVPTSKVKVTVQVEDGFGNVRYEWPVSVEGVASGTGKLEVELVEGQTYVVRAVALGYTKTATITPKGAQMTVTLVIPTGKLTARVVDGFGNVRYDWPIEVVGVAEGRGTVGPVEVLAGDYAIRTRVFGRELTQMAHVDAGKEVSIEVQVPTALLTIIAVDDDQNPIDRYVEGVEISGPVNLILDTPPKDLELLEGTYTVTVTALGKSASQVVVLANGETSKVRIVIPGTAGVDLFGRRIPLPVFLLLIAVAIAGSVGAIAVVKRGRPKRGGEGAAAVGCAGLIEATRRGDTSAVKKLLDFGCNPNLRGEGGATALHMASQLGKAELVRLLLSAGADPNARDANGRTPLHIAAEAGHLEVAKALLERGAEKAARDNQGKRPYDIAREKGHNKLAELLKIETVELEDIDETKLY